jgi:hypothetical protein
MKPKIILWLPGKKTQTQHQRLRVIMAPLCAALAQMGYGVGIKSIHDDDLSANRDCAHIWLATNLGEAPPRNGVNILWFLSQMKVMTHLALQAYDAIVTASPAHAAFLGAWLGDARHIGVAGWPVAPIPILDPVRDHISRLDLTAEADAQMTQISALPAEGLALQSLFCRHGEMAAHLPLRERMCGFYRYEEVVALLSGCKLHTAERRGLPATLERLIDGAGGQRFGALQDLQKDHDPARIAEVMIAAIVAAQARAAQPGQRMVGPGHGFRPSSASPQQDEWQAFARDAAYILEHPALAALGSPPENDRRVDLSQPWDITARLPIALDAAPRPWTDLSLLRCVCDHAQAGKLPLRGGDRARLAAMVQILRSHSAAPAQGKIAQSGLTKIPWGGVALASQDPKRIFTDLSRALNGHNLYQFSQRLGKPKALSPKLEVAADHPAQMPGKAAIFLHAYYVEIAQDMLDAMTPALWQYPLFITTDTPGKADALDAYLRDSPWPRYEIRQVENTGRDIYPKLVCLRDVHLAHDVVLHLHTKKSPHSPSLRAWGRDALMRLAGSADAIAQTAKAFAADEALGIIYPDPPMILHPAMSWVRNLRLAEFLAAMMPLDALPPSADLDFPAGSMFWARTAAIKPILELPLTADCFAAEDGQEDGCLSHAIERLIGAACHAHGFRMARL